MSEYDLVLFDKAKILDDSKKYLGCEVCAKDGLCYGIAADNGQIAVFTYDDHGENAKLVAWASV